MLNSCTINGFTNSTGVYIKSNVLNFHLVNSNISWVGASPLFAGVRFTSSVSTIYDVVYANIVSSNNFINAQTLVYRPVGDDRKLVEVHDQRSISRSR